MRSRLLAAVAVALALGAGAMACAGSTGSGGRDEGAVRSVGASRSALAPPPFAPTSIFNAPIAADASVASGSSEMVRWLAGSVTAHGTWLNSTSCGMPLYWAPPKTPRVRVRLDHPSYADPALIAAWSSVPIPPAARPADCSDRNFSVAQRQPDGRIAEWEFWNARREGGHWVAGWGGAMDDLRTDSGVASTRSWTNPHITAKTPWEGRGSNRGWNVTASSISMNAGVITQAELRAGVIPHALAVALNDTARDRWLDPAQRTDGGSPDPDAIPEGARLRLDPQLDLASLRLSPGVRALAEAAQRYGMVVRDRTLDANVLYAQPPAPGRPDEVTRFLSGQSPAEALGTFPWGSLQVLEARECTWERPCPEQ